MPVPMTGKKTLLYLPVAVPRSVLARGKLSHEKSYILLGYFFSIYLFYLSVKE